ncbi:response regulator [Dactylosporangium siamense]|uniref:DNA-binding response regulator n=1 Tax=Dactylosporangium siamense TaxID=685454 RepID=A0A919PX13_9ACTN|nr:response regulator transcription factor [Dactylosporangium siamense]GIG51862.1 DNA-binding response regulator [Dactylosporangium siamense]
MITVMVVDDQPMVRAGIAAVVDAEPDLSVVAVAADGAEAVTAARRLRPDVVLMDIRMPGMDGLAATERLTTGPDPLRVLVLTTFGLDEYVYAALRAGASGFLLKDADPQRVVDAVRVVAAGDSLIDPALTRQLIDAYVGTPALDPAVAAGVARLTAREVEILRRVARGLTNAEIGAELGVRPATVKAHMNAILAKLDLRDRVQATIFAYDAGLARPGLQPGVGPGIRPRPDDPGAGRP